MYKKLVQKHVFIFYCMHHNIYFFRSSIAFVVQQSQISIYNNLHLFTICIQTSTKRQLPFWIHFGQMDRRWTRCIYFYECGNRYQCIHHNNTL